MLTQLFDSWFGIILLIAIISNFFAFVLVGIDKSRSSQEHRRVPEVYFFVWATLLSALGVLLGMLIFHHKTRKWSFIFGITLLAIQQIILIYSLSTKLA